MAIESLPYSSDNSAEIRELRIPPHSIEAEQAVLGGLMLDNQAWDKIADRVYAEDFYRQDHRLIFTAIHALAERSDPSDVITLSEWLESRGDLEVAGGLAYLGALAKDTPSAANIEAYANIVHERAVLRMLIGVGNEIADSAFRFRGRDSRELLDEAEQKVFQIAEQGNRQAQGFRSMRSLMKGTVDLVQELAECDDPITGLATGYAGFDEITSGLQRGELIIVAGRPSMGKTAYAINIGEYIAVKEKKPVAVFSMEMSGEQLSMRLLSSMARIDASRIRSGNLNDRDWPRFSSAASMLSETPIFIDDAPALSPTELRARARRLAREQGHLGLIVVDYLQLMQVVGTQENRATEISEISRSLKALAKELSVPIMALSQLNRSLEQRPNKRPLMSDLRESGALEQDADLIVFIYRDEIYNPESADKGMAEIIIAKQRNGPIGTVKLTFLGQYTRFENSAPDIYTGDDFP